MRVINATSGPGQSGRSSRIGRGSASSTRAITAIASSAANGRRPVSATYSTTPSDQTSLAASIARAPRACSGDMYAGVPTRALSTVRSLTRSTKRATPKSSSLARSAAPSGRKTFAVFTSRCTMWRACAAASACAMRRASAKVSAIDSGARAIRSLRSSPRSHSIAR